MRLLGLVVVGVTACASSVEHVTVIPLPPNPTPAQRQWFWDTYRPAGRGMESLTVCNRDRYGTHCDTTERPLLILPDHREVRDPAGFAPLVAPGSRTMTEAESAHTSEQRMQWFGLGTVAGVVGGFVVAGYGHSSGNDTMLVGGLGVAVTSLLAGGIAHLIEKDHVREARAASFGWYPHDLAENLHLCFNGMTVTPCEANTPGAPPPSPPRDPNLDEMRQR